ncbi:MAG: cytochrome b/b6 domain-containing protein [Acidilobaceae archaeon]
MGATEVRGMEEDRKIELLTAGYRTWHLANLTMFALLFTTGLLFVALPWTSWLAYAVGTPLATLSGLDPETYAVTAGVQLLRTLHRLLGLIWGGVIIAYFLYLLLSGRIVIYRALMKPLGVQLREAFYVAKVYTVGGEIPEDVRKHMHRHNVLAVYANSLLVLGFVMLGISGVSLMLLSHSEVELHRLMIVLHNLGFYTIMLFVMSHIFASLHPRNFWLASAMFGNGMVSEKHAREDMPAYFAEKK